MLNSLIETLKTRQVTEDEMADMVDSLKGLEGFDFTENHPMQLVLGIAVFGNIHSVFNQIEKDFVKICARVISLIKAAKTARESAILINGTKVEKFIRLMIDINIGDDEQVVNLRTRLVDLDFITNHSEKDELEEVFELLKNISMPLIEGNDALIANLTDVYNAVTSLTPLSSATLIDLKNNLVGEFNENAPLDDDWVEYKVLRLMNLHVFVQPVRNKNALTNLKRALLMMIHFQ